MWERALPAIAWQLYSNKSIEQKINREQARSHLVV